MKIKLTAAALLIAGAPAFAWEKEPKSVLGVELGASITRPGIPACTSAPSEICLKTFEIPGLPVRYTIEGHPFTYATFSVVVSGDQKIIGVSAWMKQPNFQRFIEILVERYGRPTGQESEKVANLAGAQLPSAKLYWVGKEVSITAMERLGRIDESGVFFQNNAEAAKSMIQRKIDSKGAAGKL